MLRAAWVVAARAPTAKVGGARHAMPQYLLSQRRGCSAQASGKSPMSPLGEYLEAMILSRGPLSVAEFMRTTLTHPHYGYYMTRDVFGETGDFVTAPEVCSVFGELVGLWCIATWEQLGRPASISLVELGPGRGTLMRDLLRIARHFPAFYGALRVHMCDASPALMALQQQRIGCGDVTAEQRDAEFARMGVRVDADDEGASPTPPAPDGAPQGDAAAAAADPVEVAAATVREQLRRVAAAAALAKSSGEQDASVADSESPLPPWRRTAPLKSMRMPQDGPFVHWHRDLDDVPPGPALFVCQEFFDAMPVHQFEFTERGWVERLVDVATPSDPHHFRFVLAPHATPATQTLVHGRRADLFVSVRAMVDQAARLAAGPGRAAPQSSAPVEPIRPGPVEYEPPETRRLADEAVGDRVEVSAEGIITMQKIALRLGKHGGGALVVDYGVDHASGDSLRGIKKHQFVHPLQEPGVCDLSADVDFSALRRAAKTIAPTLRTWGPTTQSAFLHAMGIGPRLSQLLQAADGNEEKQHDLLLAYQRLTAASEMGSLYKALAVVSPPVAECPGFESWQEN